jgi:hypothetical protein
MPKDTDDMEDIILLLIDLLLNANISHEYIKNKFNEFHYCITCMQHFNRCKCDIDNDISDNDMSDNDMSDNDISDISSVCDDYTSSECADSENDT